MAAESQLPRLEKPEDWAAWIEQVELYAKQHEIWDLVDPDGRDMREGMVTDRMLDARSVIAPALQPRPKMPEFNDSDDPNVVLNKIRRHELLLGAWRDEREDVLRKHKSKVFDWQRRIEATGSLQAERKKHLATLNAQIVKSLSPSFARLVRDRLTLKAKLDELCRFIPKYYEPEPTAQREFYWVAKQNPIVDFIGDNQTEEEATLQIAAKLAPYNPPYVVDDRDRVNSTLTRAGFVHDQFVKPRGSDVQKAAKAANDTAKAYIEEPGSLVDVGNGWKIAGEDVGIYSTNYNMRYMVAHYGYLMLTEDQCLYPFPGHTLDVEEGKAALFTFTELPKIKDGGFWSLTAYGPDLDFTENQLGVYTLCDHNNLTFPDGTPISDGGEGTFQILLQAADTEPPSNWTNNWLPSTNGSASITVALRWYGPEREMYDGTYVHPDITDIDAITA